MQLFYLFLLAVVLVLVGIFYLLRGLRNNLEEEKIVPIADIKEIQDYKRGLSAIQQPVVSASIAEHIIKENVELKTQLAVQEKSGAIENELRALRLRVDELQKENSQVRDALALELSNKVSLSPKINDDEYKSELTRLKEINERLTNENARLARVLEEDKKALERSESEAADLKRQLSQITAQDHLRIQTLEGQINKFNQEQETLTHNKLVLDRLSAENQDLLFQLREKDAAIERILIQKEQLVSEYELKLKVLNERIDEMYKKLSSEDISTLKMKHAELQAQYARAIEENKALGVQTQALSSELNSLKEMQAVTVEREQFLQYELTKSRAQLLGLERLCEDFKIQIESTHN